MKTCGKNITCPHHKSNIYCSSIHKGIVQDCVNDDIAGGWVSCMDIDKPCPINDYWINKDTVYVKDGCGGRIHLCYTRDAPATQTKERTMECRHWNSSYKVCKVKDAQKVRSIEKIAQFPITTGSQCNKGIDYGIIEDSMWINNGCNGIYKVEYYSDKPSSFSPPTTNRPSSTTAAPLQTTKFPGGNIQKNNTTTSRSIWDYTPSHTSTTPSDPVTRAPPGTIWSDGFMGITVGILCGVFLMFLLTCLAILWFVRRYRVERRMMDKEKKAKSAYQRDEAFVDDGRHYEEIHPRDTPYEAQPFLSSPNGIQGQKPMNGSLSEPNNNPSNNRPPLGENYFILEPSQRRSNTPNQNMVAIHPNTMETFHSGIHGFIPCMPGHHYLVQGPSPHHQAVQSQHPTVPPAHLIPLREKYIISDHRSLETPGIVRYPDRNNTIGSCQVSGFRHSPVNFTQDRPGQYSLDRLQNMQYVQRSTSVCSQTDLPEGGEEEGYDKIEEFRQSIRAPSEKSSSHHYDQVQLTESPSHGTESRSQSTKSTQDSSTSC
ncbi:uncharacterized protein LOC130048513 isoform X3 [Ostrea edulis]|uniref:uncharacterized protein LOC130048513 isoform X3 n=1 Tax=Ostrea edulis TaxID=37623 RepID=UPI0024AEC00A|nr:uncharacterized protein LOC130048513 isoform X3 [Ostrea edulis]